MYCEKCGSKNSENATFCTNCGNKLSNSEPNDQVLESSTLVDNNVNNVQNSNVVTNEEEPVYNNVNNAQTNVVTEPEGSKFGWGVLGFFVPLVGLILFFTWKKDRPKSSKAAGIGALVSVILKVISIIVVFMIGVATSTKSIIADTKTHIDTEYKDTDKDDTSDSKKDDNKEFSAGEKFMYGNFEIVVGKNYTFDTVNNEFSSDNGKTVVKVPITVKNTGTTEDCFAAFDYTLFDPNGVKISDLGLNFKDSVVRAGSEESCLTQNKSFSTNIYIEYTENGSYKIKFKSFSNSAQVSINISK